LDSYFYTVFVIFSARRAKSFRFSNWSMLVLDKVVKKTSPKQLANPAPPLQLIRLFALDEDEEDDDGMDDADAASP
jgi:hypothetical protein